MTLNQLIKFLKANNDYILTAHESPDADALGAEYALYYILKALAKNVVIINAEPCSNKFKFIDRANIIKTIKHDDCSSLIHDNSIFVVLDTNDVQHLGSISDIIAKHQKFVVIDHHEVLCIDESMYVDSTAASTSELVFEIAEKLNIQLPLDAAEGLYAGIVYDTGSFIYSKTTPKTFKAGLELVKLGVKPYTIHGYMFESSTTSMLLLEKEVLSSLELLSENRIAIQTMTKEIIVATGAEYEDAETLINIPLQAKSVEVSIFFKENLEGIMRCSFRSKGNINVAHIAQIFGGGGHKTAAGFKCQKSMSDLKTPVLNAVIKALPK